MVLTGRQLPLVELLFIDGELCLQVLFVVLGDDFGLVKFRVVDIGFKLLPLFALGVTHLN